MPQRPPLHRTRLSTRLETALRLLFRAAELCKRIGPTASLPAALRGD